LSQNKPLELEVIHTQRKETPQQVPIRIEPNILLYICRLFHNIKHVRSFSDSILRLANTRTGHDHLCSA